MSKRRPDRRPGYLRPSSAAPRKTPSSVPQCTDCGRPLCLSEIIPPLLLNLYERVIAKNPPPDGVVAMHEDGTLRWTDGAGLQHFLHVDAGGEDDDPTEEIEELTAEELVDMLSAKLENDSS